MENKFKKDLQYYKFGLYGFFKNLSFFDSFLILFFLEKGLLFVAIGVLYSIREIAIAIMEIPSGVIADALGRRRTLILAFLGYIISFVAFYVAEQFFWLAFAMLLYAVADAFRTGVHKAMIFQYLKANNWEKQKVAYYGHTRSYSQFGSAISALGAGLIVFYTGNYSSIFLASIIPYMMDMILIWSYPKFLDGEMKKLEGVRVKQKFLEVIQAFSITFKKMLFIKVLFSLSIFSGYYNAVKDYVQPMIKSAALALPVFVYLNDEKKSAILISIFYFFTYLATAYSSRVSGKFNDLFHRASKPMNLTIIIGFSAGVLTGLTYFLGIYSIAIIGFLAIMMIENLRKPIGIGLVANLSKDESMASVMSAESQTNSLFTALIAPLIGFLADWYSPGTGIAIATGLLILLLPFYWLNKKLI